MSRLLGFYGTQVRVLWEWRGGRGRAVQAPRHHARRGDGLVPRDRLAPAADAGRRLRSPAAFAVILIALFNAVIRPVILALAAPVSLILVGGPRPRPPGRGVHRRRPVGAGRPCRCLRDGPRRVVHLRDHQHDPHRDPRGRQRRLVLRAPRPAPAGQALAGPLGQAGPRDHPDRRPRPSDPGRPDARRLGQHDGQLGPRRHATSCRAGRRSCRR